MGDSEELYEFSSPPTVPREKGEYMLVKIQAVSPTNPCLLVKSYRLSSKVKVLDVRRTIQSDFDHVFENGFVFLCKNTEVVTSRERTLSLKDILPKAALGKPSSHTVKSTFLYPPDVSYKWLTVDRDGQRHHVTCIGLLFLCDASGVSHWNHRDLRQRLDAHSTFGFTFIPSDITSARPDVNESLIEELNQYAAVSKLETTKQNNDSEENNKQEKQNFKTCKENIEKLLKTSKYDEEKLKDRRLSTPLHYAAQGGHLKMCQFLCMRLDKAKLLYEKDLHGRTPLHCTLSRIGVRSSKKHLKVVAYLLTYISDSDTLNSEDKNGLSCYRMILSLKKEHTIFLMRQLDPDMINQKLVLHFCCCALQYRELSEARRYCESVSVIKPTFLRPPLHLAAEFGDRDIIIKLLNAGHKVLDKDPDGHLPFHYACHHGNSDFIKLLYHKDMEEEDVEKGVRLALFWKKFVVLGEIAEVADVIQLDPDLRQTLLIQAEQNLKKHGKSLLGCLMKGYGEQKNENILVLSRFVSQAASLGLTDLLQGLLKICHPTYSDSMLRTPLHEAVQGPCFMKGDTVKKSKRQSNCLECFKMVLQETKALTVVDWRGSTPLHYACMEGNIDLVKFILTKKDLRFASMQDAVGRTPLLVAVHYQKGRKTLDYLINHHFEHMKPYSLDMYGKSILHYISYIKSGLVDVLLGKMKNLEDDSTGPYQPKPFAVLGPRKTLHEPQVPNITGFLLEIGDGQLKCRYCDQELQENNGTHFCQFLFQTLPANTELSPLETLIVMDRADLLKKLMKEMPSLLDGDKGLKATFCAVKMWRLGCAEVLIKDIRKHKKYLNKYLLAALEEKPAMVLVRQGTQSGTHSGRCRLASLKMRPSGNETESQCLMVKYLLKIGASPCYIPHQYGYKAGSKQESSFLKYNEFGSVVYPPRLNKDIPGSLRRYCTALERAIIIENVGVVDILLKHPHMRLRESFAIHLAVKAGNVDLLGKMLQKFKKEQFIFGKAETELEFVSTLPNGILGAASVSEKPSFALFQVIHQIAPEIFKGTKLITAKLLANSRPAMLDILRIHDVIPLVLFMRKQHPNLSFNEKERIVCFILQNGSYPNEMRIKKKSFIHPVCDLYITALRRKMWKVLAILLHKSGSTLWKCLFGASEDKIKCHSILYSPASLAATNLKDLLGNYASVPVEIMSMFTHAGLRTLTTLDQYVKDDLLDEVLSTDKDDKNDKNIQTLFLEWVVPKLWGKPINSLIFRRSKKLMPYHSSPQTNPTWAPSPVNFEVTSLPSVINVIKDSFQHISPTLLDQIIHVRKQAMFMKDKAKYKSLERGLVFIQQRLRRADRDRPALWLAVAFGDRSLAKYILKSRNGISLSDEESDLKVLDLAARKADLPMIKLLMKHGAVPTDLTLQYGSGLRRKCFMEEIWQYTDPYVIDPCGMKWYESETEEDHIRLSLVKYMCERMHEEEKDSYPRYTGVLREAAKGQKWLLVDYLLEMGATVLDLPEGRFDYRSEENESSVGDSVKVFEACECLLAILSRASAELALKTLKVIGDVKWDKLSLHLILVASAESNKPVVMNYLLQEVLFRSPLPLDKPEDVVDVICKRRPYISGQISHYGAALHLLCRNGDTDNVKLILTNLKCESIQFINALDGTRSTPLWYAVAYRHWELAELLLLNGAILYWRCRAIPDFRMLRVQYAQPKKKTRITSIKLFPGNHNESRNVAVAMKSKSDVFLKPQAIMKMKQTFESYAHISDTKFSSRSPPKPSMDKRVEKLMKLVLVGASLGGSIYHAAVLDGDIGLMKEIQSQPMFDAMKDTSEGLSAGVLAFANLTKIIKECRRYPAIMGDATEVVKRASQVMIYLSQVTLSEILKLKDRKENEESKMKGDYEMKMDTDHKVKPFIHSLRNMLATNDKEGSKLRYFIFPYKNSAEDLAREVLELLPLSADQTLPNEFIVALAVLSKSKLFTTLEDKLKINQMQNDVTSRDIMEGCTITDFIILLSPDKEIKEVYNCLESLARMGALHINDEVLMFAMRRNMTSVLRIIAESINSKSPERMMSKPWLDAFVLAASKGDNALLKILMKGLANYSSSQVTDAFDRAMSASSSKGYSDIVEILTSFAGKKGILKDLNLHDALKQSAKYGRVQVAKQLFKLCLKSQKMDINLLMKILKRTKFSGSRTFFQSVLDFGGEAFRAEKDKLINEIPKVLLQSAKNGHEQLCLYILEKFPDVDLKQKSKDRKKEVTVKGQKRVISQDNKDATTLHYACEHGSKKLALKLLEKDPQLADIKDRDKRHPIQYAKAMGMVSVLQEMSLLYGMTAMGEITGEIQYFGWLRHCLTKNAEIPSEDIRLSPRLYPTVRFSKCYMTVEDALKHKDEEAALSMFYAAEGDLMDQMKKIHHGPIHQASKFGCAKFLVAIFKRFEDNPDILKAVLMTEVEGNTPLALAVQGKHTECVKLLIDQNYTPDWKSSKTKETIFHFAAKTNDLDILNLLLQNADDDISVAPSNIGMTPALYSIALGHHLLVSQFFKHGYPQNPQHNSHKETDYTCHECLLDRCIGWSKLYLSQQHISQPTAPRDIWERRQRTTGFISQGSTKTHVLEGLLEYAAMSKNINIVQNALVCMGYEPKDDIARLLLLQSKNGNHVDSVKHCLAQGWESTVIALLDHINKKEDKNFYSQVLDLAVAAASMEVVKYVIKEHPTLAYSKELMEFTSIEVAISMQRYDIYEVLLSKVPQDAVADCFKNLPDIEKSIPLCVQYLTGISHPGQETWLESIQESRLSDANCLMLHNSNTRLKEKLETTSKLDSVFPEKIFNVPLSVDIESFRRGCPVQVTDSWLRLVVASYLQTLKSVLEEANQLQEIDVLELSCLPTSNKVPFMEISGRSLRDRVKLEKVDASSMREPLLFIKGSERLPNKLHLDAHFKKMVEAEIIEEAENLTAYIMGHKVRVKVDWPSFNAEHTEEIKTTVYRILAGRDPHSALGGLLDVLKLCRDLCDDIRALHGDGTVKSVQDLLVPLREIVVKHSVSLTRTSKTLFCLIDQSMVWFVNYKNDSLVYHTSNFPLYCVLKACHSVCVNMSGGLRQFEMEVVKPSRHSKKKRMRIEPHIDWKSFGSIGDTVALSVLGRNGIRLEMLRLAAGYKHLMWYDKLTKGMPNMFVLKNVPLASQSDLTIDEEAVTLSMYAARSHNAGWVSTGLDIYSRLQDLEIKWLLEENSYQYTARFFHMPEVFECFGLKISIPHEDRKWFEEIVRRENRQMTRPYKLLELYIQRVVSSVIREKKKARKCRRKKKDRFEQNTGLEEMLEDSIKRCPGVWPVQKMESLPGLWFWVTIAELQNGISYDKFIVKVEEDVGRFSTKIFYRIMSKQKACMLEAHRVRGVWYHQSFNKRTDLKTAKRLQLMSLRGMIYFISDPLTVHRVLQMIPSTIKMGLCTTDLEEDDGAFYVQFGFWDNSFSFHTRLMSGIHGLHVDSLSLFDCWNRSSDLGINVVIDTDDFRENLFGSQVVEQIAEGTVTSLEQFVEKADLTTQHLCSELLSSQGVLLVGKTNFMENEKTAWTAGAIPSNGEYVTIYPLSETDIFICYEKALRCLTETKAEENPVYILSTFSKTLNHAFGHKVTKVAKEIVSNTLKDISIPWSSTVDISYLEPTSEDIFIPQAQIVMENIPKVFTCLPSASLEMMIGDVKEIRIRKKNSDNDFNITKLHRHVLTIFAVNKEMPLPLEHLMNAMMEAFTKDMSLLNGLYPLYNGITARSAFSDTGVRQGKYPNQIVLKQKKFELSSNCDHICWGTYTQLTEAEEMRWTPGKCIRNVYPFGKLFFEVTYAPAFRRKLCSVARVSSYEYSVMIYRPRVFFRTRCKHCRSYLPTNTEISSLPAGVYLEVIR